MKDDVSAIRIKCPEQNSVKTRLAVVDVFVTVEGKQ
jgi:hypothetical protein